MGKRQTHTMEYYTEQLKRSIRYQLYHEFDEKHLSRNLVGTIYETKNGNDEASINIPATVYDQYLFLKYGVVVHQPEKGSYASSLNRSGSKVLKRWLGHHRKYVEHSIDKGIRRWRKSTKVKIVEIKNI